MAARCRRDTPAGIRRLLRRCLQKDPKRRLRDIARRAARNRRRPERGTQQNERVAQARSGRRERLAWASALALVALIAAVLGVRALRPAPTAPEARLEINTPPTRDPSLAISPDGLKIVFVARSAGQSQLWLRSLDSPSARPLAGTERASSPFWSPDSRSIGFFADTKLKRMDIDGGSVQTLASGVPVASRGRVEQRRHDHLLRRTPADRFSASPLRAVNPPPRHDSSRRNNGVILPRSSSPMAGTFSSS